MVDLNYYRNVAETQRDPEILKLEMLDLIKELKRGMPNENFVELAKQKFDKEYLITDNGISEVNIDKWQMHNFLESVMRDLQHHYDTTKGLYVTDHNIKDLLHDFWQRSSDACPLECTEYEQELVKWDNWIRDLYWQI